MNAPPKWLRPVAVVAVLWNLLGCLAFLADLSMTADDVARLDATQRALMESRPVWAIAGTALAVFAGALGSLGLALLRRWAVPLLAASLLGVLVQDAGFALAGVWPGAVVVGLQAFVLVVAVALFLLARRARDRGWLR
jgi:hypothetical protein